MTSRAERKKRRQEKIGSYRNKIHLVMSNYIARNPGMVDLKKMMSCHEMQVMVLDLERGMPQEKALIMEAFRSIISDLNEVGKRKARHEQS